MNNDKQLDKLKAALQLLDQGAPSKEEVTELFTALVSVVKDISQRHAQNVAQLGSKIGSTEQNLRAELQDLVSGVSEKLAALSKKTGVDKDNITQQIISEVNRLEELIAEKSDDTLLWDKIAQTDEQILKILPDSPEQLRDKLASLQEDERLPTTAIKGLEVLKDLPDIRRMAQANANAQAVPVTTTFFYKNGGIIGRAKNINFIEGNNISLNVYQTGDQMNISVTSTASGAGNFATEETPSGTIDGVNVTFTLAHTPTTGTVKLYLNGSRQQSGGADYSITGGTITFTTAPQSGSILLVDYQY